MIPRSPRGFTLAEVMVVIALAGVVTLGLVAFYLNSQAMWLESSSQALAQRDATLITELVTNDVRRAASFDIDSTIASSHVLTLFDSSHNQIGQWQRGDQDSLVHRVVDSLNVVQDYGAVATSVVEQFRFSPDINSKLLHLQLLQVRSTTGQLVQISSTIALYNAP
jgi:prepilin-type N-terminal cleavage/methylation domain-containing protein